MVFNAVIGNQQEVIIIGDIIDMSSSSGRSNTTYKATVKDNNSNEIKKLEISSKEFKTYKTGDKYQKTWLKGSLGFIYRKK